MYVAVSACLIGEKVRYDGGHKRDDFIVEELSKYAKLIPFCPEALAFGTPRESLRVIKEESGFRIVSNKKGIDLTDELHATSTAELQRINSYPLTGIVFKSRSPSCGMGSAKAYLQNGFIEGKADGVFAKKCKENFPLLPMEEEGRLQDAWLRENFVMQLFAYEAIEKLKASKPEIKDLVEFHASHKFLLQSKDEKLYRELGNIVANHQKLPLKELLNRYEESYKLAISKKSSIKKNRNVLLHMAGFLKNHLSKIEKDTLHEQIEEYAKKIVPIILPLSTLKLYTLKYDVKYLANQVFLDPYPKDLALRSNLNSSK